MTLETRIKSFADLGTFLRKFTSANPSYTKVEEEFAPRLEQCVKTAVAHNGWFTEKNIYFNLREWGANLTADNLNHWLSSYQIQDKTPQTVAVIMAGNIPLVGFHDFLCVLLSGHKALVKQSSKDKKLLPCMRDFLVEENSGFADLVEFKDELLKNFDAVIATGSNNTARYFDYYFSENPHIIRKNRNGVAVLSGGESKEELSALGEDIFRYYGLGCRNVSKLFVPQDYNFSTLFEAVYPWEPLKNHHKYANNYDYNKAVYLMSEFEFLDNGFLILKEDENYASPIACLFYEYYQNETGLKQKLKEDKSEIQCVLSDSPDVGDFKLGESQHPKLTDYADGVDTLAFLSGL